MAWFSDGVLNVTAGEVCDDGVNNGTMYGVPPQDDRNITQLELDDAFVRPLEQNSFQRTINGRPWLVHEIRYAIFPEHSGTLEIPSQRFSARESTPRRSLFDLGGGGRQVRRSTEPLTIEVLPRPDSFPGSEWLPAGELTLEESWSTPPEALKVGESATRFLDAISLHLRYGSFAEGIVSLANLVYFLALAMVAGAVEAFGRLDIAVANGPADVCLVPEKRQELTTEGGLDVREHFGTVRKACERLAAAGIRVSLFVDPDADQLRAAAECGAPVVELHTGRYCEVEGDERDAELKRIVRAAAPASSIGSRC